MVVEVEKMLVLAGAGSRGWCKKSGCFKVSF